MDKRSPWPCDPLVPAEAPVVKEQRCLNCFTKVERIPLRLVDRAPGQHTPMKQQQPQGITGETNYASVRRCPWTRGNSTINSSNWAIVTRFASIVNGGVRMYNIHVTVKLELLTNRKDTV